MRSGALVITSIAVDTNPVLRLYGTECHRREMRFIVIGDQKSPAQFSLEGCDFWSLERQLGLSFELSRMLPTGHYSRKNLGYLLAMQSGVETLLETDDDNLPRPVFFADHQRESECEFISETGWINVYEWFTDARVWPRGFPLEELETATRPKGKNIFRKVHCPIQQGLADENPDVDAVYRLTCKLPVRFENNALVGLGRNAWSPFNSQNTFWFSEAFPLLYLPSCCSFRMTDIWRSFVAQRIAWENDWAILYYGPTVWQERNEHRTLRDFEDEVPGYLNNGRIRTLLEGLHLKKGPEAILDNLATCYECLIQAGFVDERERDLVQAWSRDVRWCVGKSRGADRNRVAD
jgi:hypothetical protein